MAGVRFQFAVVAVAALALLACHSGASAGPPGSPTDGQTCDDAAATASTDGAGFDCGPLRCDNSQECVMLDCGGDASCGPVFGCYDLPPACNGVASCACLQASACHNQGQCTTAGQVMSCRCI